MYFNILNVKGRPQPRYPFPCIVLYNLSSEGQNRSKHVVDDNLMCSVLKVVLVMTINILCNFK